MLPVRIERFPTIETQRLLLREIVVSDKEKLFALRNNPAVTRYLGRDDDKDTSAVESMILKMHGDLETGAGIQWGICLSDSNELIGVVCLWRIDKRHHRAEIGFLLRPESWRQGIMSEALEAVLAYAFHTLRLHRIVRGLPMPFSAETENVAKRFVLRRPENVAIQMSRLRSGIASGLNQ